MRMKRFGCSILFLALVLNAAEKNAPTIADEHDVPMELTASTLSYEAVPDSFIKEQKVTYVFWDHILVYSGLLESRHILLKDVPYSGYYRVEVTALYSPAVEPFQDKEQYRFCIALPETTVVGPIVPDQNSGPSTGKKVQGPKARYDYYRNDHGLLYLKKGTNEIWFRCGDQYVGAGQNNSVEFHGIRLLWQHPAMVAEPQFSRSTTNTVYYRPVYSDVYDQQVICIDKTASLRKPSSSVGGRKALPDTVKAAVFNGLRDGHTYGYYVETYLSPTEVIYSDTTWSTQDATPPGQVVIDPMSSYSNRRAELFWQEVEDIGSGVAYYQVIRYEKINGTLTTVAVADIPAEAGPPYQYVDQIPPASGEPVYQYRIDAVDRVGNRSTGVVSKLVVGIQAPKVSVIDRPVADRFHQGALLTLTADISGLAIPESHFVQFEVARDSIKFFADRWRPNTFFFESGWLPVRKSQPPTIQFDLSAGGRHSLSFIDGHRYYIRARFKDLQDNHSDWSSPDTLYVIPDCFAPDDIPWLTVTPYANESNIKGWMELNWGDTQDLTSGLAGYLVYRKIEGVDSSFVQIAQVQTPAFVDSFASIGYNRPVYYKVGSVDRVSNKRSADESAFTAGARCQAAPMVDLTYEAEADGKRFTSRSMELLIADLSNFKFDESIAKIVIRYNDREFDFSEAASLSLMPGVNSCAMRLLEEGPHTVNAKVVFSDKTESLWSPSVTVIKVEDINNLPQPGQNHGGMTAAYNFPNPFNPTTQIFFTLEQDAHVTVDVYNVQGRRVRTLLNRHERAGTMVALWNGLDEDGRQAASGLYFYIIRTRSMEGKEGRIVRSMLLLK